MDLQVGVKALIRDNDGRFLLLHRTEPLLDGSGMRWDIPGGKINANERLPDALQREVLKETGLALEGEPVLVAAQDIFIMGAGQHVVRLTYVARAKGFVRLGDEHQEYRWLKREGALGLPVDDYLRAVLESL
ncbi:MAG: MutT/nudix family protein [Patescibacteria group bacterium]|nr:MutT/nudix family protein [Patescibacteria group bacterium]